MLSQLSLIVATANAKLKHLRENISSYLRHWTMLAVELLRLNPWELAKDISGRHFESVRVPSLVLPQLLVAVSCMTTHAAVEWVGDQLDPVVQSCLPQWKLVGRKLHPKCPAGKDFERNWQRKWSLVFPKVWGSHETWHKNGSWIRYSMLFNLNDTTSLTLQGPLLPPFLHWWTTEPFP